METLEKCLISINKNIHFFLIKCYFDKDKGYFDGEAIHLYQVRN